MAPYKGKTRRRSCLYHAFLPQCIVSPHLRAQLWAVTHPWTWRPSHWAYFDRIRNSMKISKHSSVKYTRPITTIFSTHHDSVTVVTCAQYRCDRSSISSIFETRAFWIFIEFDRNMLSGTGAWLQHHPSQNEMSILIHFSPSAHLVHTYSDVHYKWAVGEHYGRGNGAEY